MGFCSVLQSWHVVLVMVAVQTAFAGLNIISKMALNRGVPFYVFVVYRYAVAAATLSPCAYVLERKTRPKLTRTVLMKTFVSALLGSSLNHCLYYAGMQYAPLTVTCAVGNMVPAVTFLMAVALRMEKLSVSTTAGQAKLLGTLASIGGGMLITFYKGPAVPFPSLQLSKTTIEHHAAAAHPSSLQLLKGVILVLGSTVFFSSWFILQAKIDSNYCAQYSTMALMCVFAALQAGSASLVLQLRRPDWHAWKLHGDSTLAAVIYAGVVGTAICYSLMSWVNRTKGPLIVTMFSPLQLIMVALMSTIFLHETLYLGSVVALVLIMIGVYAVVWGKSREMNKVVQAQSHHVMIAEQPAEEREEKERKHEQKTLASEDDDEANGKHSQDTNGGVGGGVCVVVVDMVQQGRTEDGGVAGVGAR